MALQLTLQNVDASGVVVWVTGTIAASGNYSTGGDTLDWTQIMNQAVAASGAVPSAQSPQQVAIWSQNGSFNQYSPLQGSGLNNWKLKVAAPGGTEIGAGAYPGGVTGDIIVFQAQFKRLQ
jgi:hypothetical protein